MTSGGEGGLPYDRFAALGDLQTVFTWSGDGAGQLEFANDAWLAFRGRSLDRELGEGWLDGVHPADRAVVERGIADAYAAREPFELEYRVRDHAGRYRWILTRGEPRFDAHGSFLGFHGTGLSIDERVRAERGTRLLSEVGRLVASTGDPADALEAIARAAIPLLGDCCVIDLVGEDGAFTRHVLAHLDPRLEAVARGFKGPQPHSPLYGVLQDGRPVLLQNTAEEFADAGAPEDREERRSMALRSSILTPVVARGRAFGVMTFGSHVAGHHDEDDDVPLAHEVARRVALALDHASSLAEARAARRASEAARAELEVAVVHARLLADISGCLEATLDLAPALDAVAALIVGCLADAARIEIVEHGQILGAGGAEASAGALDELRRSPTDTGRTLTLPLTRSGRALGTLALLWRSGRLPDPEALPLLEEIARRVSLAADAALLYADRANTARTLQASLLPERLPRIPGVALAARYLPASGAAVSGDFYDVFDLGDGTWLLVVGDVCGKGVEAAALTAQARYTVRALAPWLLEPKAVLEALNAALRQQRDDGRFVACAVARLDPATGVVQVACGGHPAPVVLRADGRAEVVVAHGPVIGIFDAIELRQASLTLDVGDVLAVFTDGVTEAGCGDVREGADLLRELEGVRDRGPQAVTGALEALARRSGTGPPRDDVAILAVSLDPD